MLLHLVKLDKSLAPLIDDFSLPDEDIKLLWDCNRVDAANRGTYMHLTFELYLNRHPLQHYTPELEVFLKYLCSLGKLQAYRTEWMIFADQEKLDLHYNGYALKVYIQEM